MNTIVYCWLISALVTLVLEMGHPGLFIFLSWSIGSTAAALFCYYYPLIPESLLVCLLVSFLAIFILKRCIARLQPTAYATNVDALIGCSGIVQTPISVHNTGYIKVKHELWLAKTRDLKEISANSYVKIVGAHGAHLIVTIDDSVSSKELL